MSFKKIGLIAFVTSALYGCAVPQQQVLPRIPFPAAEYAALPTQGTGSLTGQVFMKTIGGDVKYGAGSSVYLLPATSYSSQWYTENYLGGKPLSTPDSRAEQGQLVTQADGTGYFTFNDVPPGKYYLSSTVTWQAPTQYGLMPQGGVVAKLVNISDGKQVREMLTK